MKKTILFLLFILHGVNAFSQGFYNHQWLLGSYLFFQDPKGRLVFDSSSYTHIPENRKMVFNGTEATICNTQGDFLMSSNGTWIANAINDTMMNGSGLNPNGITSNWASGLPMIGNNVLLPFPGDTTKYILFHHTATTNGISYTANELYYSIIDMSLDSGLGGVSTKNALAITDTMSFGIGCCKHANGRDWWIFMVKHNSNEVNVLLLTTQGITSFTQQNLNAPIAWYSSSQIVMSNSGNKISYAVYEQNTNNSSIVIADFDRCTGILSNSFSLQLTQNEYLWGMVFSPSDEFIYSCSSNHIFQINASSLSIDTVATYDGFISPPNLTCCATSFWNMYLAANGKIYITSGSGVQHLHEMNFPDSAGLACDVQQHAINLGYAQLRAVPNHPNYNLGPVVGSVCDTLSVGIAEIKHDFKFSISPNPTSDGYIKLMYLLPQNKNGEFEVYDMKGQLVYRMNLPAWSTLQMVKLPELSNGVYTCVVRSGYEWVGRKLVVVK